MKELERPLLCLETLLTQRLNATKTNRMLLSANNATFLCLHQILAGKTSGGLFSSAMP